MATYRCCSKKYILLLLFFYRFGLCVSECLTKDGRHDLTPLSRFIWNVTYREGTELIEYKVNLCSPLGISGNCTNSSVCKIESNLNRTLNLGSYEPVLSPDNDTSASGVWLKFSGGACSEGSLWRTFINLQCGKGLGFPHVVGIFGCRTYFVWETSVVCEPPLVQKQVPCYAYDPQGNTYDLSGLMRDKGGYLLTTGIEPVDFYINICADIISDDNVSGCPSGAGVCRRIGQEIVSFGEADQPLVWTKDGKLSLTYIGKNIPPGCAHLQTTIDFVCPNSGPGKVPVILSNSNCHCHIEWTIAQACPLPQLESKDSCKLSSNTNGLSVDLTPLQSSSSIPYSAEGKIDGKLYDFYFGICESSPLKCASNYNSSLVTVCRKRIDDYIGVIIGNSVNQTLRFYDHHIYLSYTSNSICKTSDSVNRTHASVIIFKCRQYASNNGIGEPVFVKEEECVSFFYWETRFACLQIFDKNNCYASNGEHLIDLTPLRKSEGEDPWQAIVSNTGNHSFAGTQIYINVCGPVGRSAALNCPPQAAVCVEDDEGNLQNFGQFVSPPVIDATTKDVLLNYTSFEPCSTNVNESKMSVIRFICRPGLMDLSPSLVRSSENSCLLEFEWHTATACLQASIEGDNCTIQNVSGGISYDLSPLQSRTYYNFSANDYDYYINICSDLKDAPCVRNEEQIAACQIGKKNNVSLSLGKPSRKLLYYNGHIHMAFTNGTPFNYSTFVSLQTMLIFVCDPNAGVGSPELVDEVNYIYSFKWKTSYVCPPKAVQCIYTEKKAFAQYDLSRLTRDMLQSNWEVTESQGNRKFYLNVCHSLVLSDSNKIPCDHSAAICVTKIKNGKEEAFIPNLGKADLSPYFEEGKLVLRYTSGQSCPNGTTGENYRAIIYFDCPRDSVHKPDFGGELVFLQVVQCEYKFIWNTYAACPLQTTETSNGCSIKSPNSGLIYNFESLSETFHIPGSQSSEFQDFNINVCGSVNSSTCSLSTNNSLEISACGSLKKDDQTVVLGVSMSRRLKLSGEDTVIITFDGPQNVTTNQPDYWVNIMFLCRRHLESSRPKFVRQEGRMLIFNFETAITCPPEEVDCTYHNGRGSTYDLSSLGHESGYWKVQDPRPGRQRIIYYLNVCLRVNAPYGSNCPVKGGAVGACKTDNTNGTAWSMGQIQGKPQMSFGGESSVTLRYLNGDVCDNGQSYRSTRIDFICSSKEEEPQFVAETMQCEYIFKWKTPVACPFRRTLGRNCKVTDPVYSNTFDLNKLSNASGYVIVFGEKRFKINLCAPLRDGCGTESKAGVCIESKGQLISGGNYSDVLVYDGGEITLTYERDGRHTLFVFLCDYSTPGYEGPTFLNSSSNEDLSIFTWTTSYACRNYKETSCDAFGPNNTRYDLNRLKLLDDNYELIKTDGQMKYFINVCRSVVHKKDVECHYGAGVCAVNLTEANVEKRYSSLGEVESGPFFENGILKLVYDMGELCQDYNSSVSHKKTTIEFFCNEHIMYGRPEFLTEHICEYNFVWYTAAACPVVQQNVIGEECTVINPNTGYKFNLNGLRGLMYIVQTSENSRLTLGVCESAADNLCGSNIGSCLESISDSAPKLHQNVGIVNAQLHYYNGDLLLNYTSGELCPHGNGTVGWSTLITFMCRAEGAAGEPHFLDVRNCTYLLGWYTAFACEKQVRCSVKADNETYDLSPLTEYQGFHFAFSTDDTDDAKYLLSVCKPLNRYVILNDCPPNAAICRIDTSSNTTSSLGIPEDPPAIDNRGQIILEYKHGSPCPFDARFNASSRIIFKCDDRMITDVLQMVEVIQECTFIFEWPTDVVCPSKAHGDVTDKCFYFDTHLQKKFDLIKLQEHSPDGFRVDTDEGLFSVSLCGSTSKSGPCAEAGVCLRKGGLDHSWGSSASKIFSVDDVGESLKVFYKDGDACPTVEKPSQHSLVVFICDENAGIGWPKLSQLDSCEAIFTWKTSFTCPEREPECIVMHEGNLYDLRLLSSYSHSWTVDTSEGEKFWINVCTGLGGRSDPRCPSDSTVCWKTSTGKVMSVGAQKNQQLFMADDGQTLKLRYSTSTNACFHGSNNAGLPTYSEIHFKCTPEAHNPTLVNRGSKFNNCTFTFEWKTPIACKERRLIEILEDDGVMKDVQRGIYLDLMPLLRAHETAIEEREHDHYLYHISLLGLTEFKNGSCNGAAICQTKIGDNSFQKNIGNFNNKKFYFRGDCSGIEFVLTLQSDSPCIRNLGKNVTSHIIMHCSAAARMSHPEFLYESADCDYVFTWRTVHVCDAFAVLYQPNDDPVEAQSSSNVGLAVGLSVMIIILAVIVFLIFRKKERRNCFFLSRQSLTSVSSQLMTMRQGHSSISFARLSEEDAAT